MSECGVCLESKHENSFKNLSCSHTLCNTCYPKLRTNKCPFCRAPFIREINTIFSSQNNIVDLYFDSDEHLSRRQVRRQNNKNYVKNKNKRPRKITNNNPIKIFYYNGEINLPQIPKEEKLQKEKNFSKRNNKNNRWNHLKNQQKINII